MVSNNDILKAFFNANVLQGKFPDDYDLYVASVINYGLAVIAQVHRRRINPDDLIKKDVIVTTESQMFGNN